MIARLIWWFVIPPRVQRPGEPVWCPRGAERFDAREILGMEFDGIY